MKGRGKPKTKNHRTTNAVFEASLFLSVADGRYDVLRESSVLSRSEKTTPLQALVNHNLSLGEDCDPSGGFPKKGENTVLRWRESAGERALQKQRLRNRFEPVSFIFGRSIEQTKESRLNGLGDWTARAGSDFDPIH